MKKLGLSLLAVSLLSTGLFAKADKGLVDEYMNISGAKITIESMGSKSVQTCNKVAKCLVKV